MLELYLRPVYQKTFELFLAKQVARWLTPLQITILACITGFLIIPALFYQQTVLALCLLLASGILDTLDGSVARLTNQHSDSGAMLDIISDRFVEFFIILGLFLQNVDVRGLACLLMLGSILICVTSFLVVAIFTQNQAHKGFHHSPGLIERFEAFVFFIAMICFPRQFNMIAYVFSGLVFLTACLRIYNDI